MAGLHIFGKRGLFPKTRKVKETALTKIGRGLEEYQTATKSYDRRNWSFVFGALAAVGTIIIAPAKSGLSKKAATTVLAAGGVLVAGKGVAESLKAKASIKELNSRLMSFSNQQITKQILRSTGTPEAYALHNFMGVKIELSYTYGPSPSKMPSVPLLNGLVAIKEDR